MGSRWYLIKIAGEFQKAFCTPALKADTEWDFLIEMGNLFHKSMDLFVKKSLRKEVLWETLER